MEFKLPYYQNNLINYKRKCINGVTFSESMLRYGPYRDTTIENATRQNYRHRRVIKRKQNAMV